jgi:hypothetical protein
VRGGQGIVVGIVTGYKLYRPGIKSQWGQGFLYLSWPAPRSTSLLYNGYWVFPKGKVAGVWHWPPTPSSTEAANRLKLYLYLPSVPAQMCHWVTFTFISK